jgi:hypothetical protein
MSKLIVLSIAAGGALVATVVVVGVSLAGTDDLPSARTLTIVQDPGAAHVTDTPPKGPSAGDLYVYSATIRSGDQVVGRLEGTTIAADSKYQGDVSTQYLALHDGTIAIVGGGQSGAPGVGRPDNRIYDAVVGGTGRYAGAGGWVRAEDISATTELMTLHFTR